MEIDTADLIIGADGAHSTVRNQMQRYVKMYYEQTYINTLWCEFTIPPHPTTGDFQLSPNHLHIWPKHSHMFIAIPSTDRTYTCTLFAPEEIFESLTTRDALLAFFGQNFEDVVGLVGGEDALCDQFFANKHLPLVSIRTGPFHHSDRCVIIGDAAHAMVPFYGQGMNAGFESVNVLFKHITAHADDDLAAALQGYTNERRADAWAIVELAMHNYDEMRSNVTKRGYLLRKWVEEGLAKWVPRLGVRTLYSMVSFGNDRYSEVLAKAHRQNRVEELALVGAAGIAVVGLGWRYGVLRAVGAGFREGSRVLAKGR
jgi:kynurenine 3-monooxygenase